MAALLSSPGVAPAKEPCAPSTLSVTVGGLACEGCARAAQKAVLGVAGVVRCAVSLGGDVDVEWSGPEPVQLQSLVFALESVGLFVTRPFEAPGPPAALLEELRDTPSARRYRCGCGCADCICAAQPVWQGDAGRDVTLEALCARLERSADLAALGASGLAATPARAATARGASGTCWRARPCPAAAARRPGPIRCATTPTTRSASRSRSPTRPRSPAGERRRRLVLRRRRLPVAAAVAAPVAGAHGPAVAAASAAAAAAAPRGARDKPPASPEPRRPAEPASPSGGGSTPGRRRHKAPKRQKSPRKAPPPRAFDDAALTDAAAAATCVTARADAACPALAGRETSPEWWRHACVALHGHRALGAAWYACDRAVKDVEEGGDLDAHLAASLYNSRSVVELDLGLWEDAEASLAKADAHHPEVALYVAALADVVLVRAAGAVLRLADAVANVDPNVGFPDSSEEYEARLDAHGFPGRAAQGKKGREVLPASSRCARGTPCLRVRVAAPDGAPADRGATAAAAAALIERLRTSKDLFDAAIALDAARRDANDSPRAVTAPLHPKQHESLVAHAAMLAKILEDVEFVA
ncbi:hypothetical protein JL720_8920 [Aureococcus anophagefferens]|nr:hypothetical protein JL720_8920 [Aureococcus anophagefferens]